MKKVFLLLMITFGFVLTLPMGCGNTPTSPANTPVPTPTLWAGYTATPIGTWLTSTPTFTGTLSPTVWLSYTPTLTPTITSTPTNTLTPTISYTPTITGTPTNTATLTFTATPTNTFTVTNTFTTPLPTQTGTPWIAAYPPNGLTANNAGTTIYVAEGAGGGFPGAVQVFSSAGISLGLWYTYSAGASFGQPYGISVDSSGDVFVLDSDKKTVYELNPAGTSLLNSWSSWTGGAVTTFLNPEGIAIDSGNNVYVADTDNATVEKFSPTGTYLSDWSNWSGGSVTAFSIPSAVALDGAGNIYVADAGTGLINVFSAPGVYANQWSTVLGSDIFGIFINGSVLYAADSGNSQIQAYSLSGNLLTAGPNSNPLISPDGIITLGANLLVSDFANNKIYQFIP